MNLYIAFEYSPEELRQELISDGLEHYESCFRIWDGRWHLMPMAYWYRKTPGERREQQRQSSLCPGWFFYCGLSLKLQPSESNAGSPGFLDAEVSFSEAIRQTVEIVLQGTYKPFKEAPEFFLEDQRKLVVREVEKMQLNYPAYPDWASSFPMAVFGDPRGFRSEAGSVFCSFNDEFSIEVCMDAFLGGHDVSAEELQQIKESLT